MDADSGPHWTAVPALLQEAHQRLLLEAGDYDTPSQGVGAEGCNAHLVYRSTSSTSSTDSWFLTQPLTYPMNYFKDKAK